MSNYNSSYNNNNNDNHQNLGQVQSLSSYEQQPQEEQFSEKQDSTKVKRRTLNPVRAMSQGTQVVVGGVTQGAQVVKGGLSSVEKGVTQVGTKLTKVPGISTGVSFFADYRKFMDRGNVIDLAVAVVIGAAFTAIVTSLVTDIITPLIALATDKNLEENFIVLRYNRENGTSEAMVPPATRQQAKDSGHITWNWGNFLQTVINFFIVSACIFLIVKVYEMGRNKTKDVTEKKCDYCLRSIPLNSVRCPNCTTWLDWDACSKTANMERMAATAAAAPIVPGGPTAQAPYASYPANNNVITHP
ncbi:large-conductance mechanosensitive channel [Gamsiella multidivaricata]|uniref:large-conductance mechanosensitive channel n=1 Tax=Gamsiella multidivaricata TaxID=101098 RepID=UPI00221E43A1|nr:large-conductance mechanosensitive channel [Gamsiella multidivaricata]KAG0353960.1 hypothetical protein BGZ54_001928 [Gamsiella multidivaricata]KAI7816171.1 large-conductance mechanosensitive channel [Gamsiella multidivaricata]